MEPWNEFLLGGLTEDFLVSFNFEDIILNEISPVIDVIFVDHENRLITNDLVHTYRLGQLAAILSAFYTTWLNRNDEKLHFKSKNAEKS